MSSSLDQSPIAYSEEAVALLDIIRFTEKVRATEPKTEGEIEDKSCKIGEIAYAFSQSQRWLEAFKKALGNLKGILEAQT